MLLRASDTGVLALEFFRADPTGVLPLVVLLTLEVGVRALAAVGVRAFPLFLVLDTGVRTFELGWRTGLDDDVPLAEDALTLGAVVGDFAVPGPGLDFN